MFKNIENAEKGSRFSLESILAHLKFDENGLIPTIAQQAATGDVLMMAWMNKEALQETLKTKRVCYWSRSRQSLWRKGESSGQIQSLVSLSIDCDGDCLLLQVDQKGPACHTGRLSCFFHQVEEDSVVVITKPIIEPDKLYTKN